VRGGWYTYDRIDNGGVPGADRLVSELQHDKAADLIHFVPGANLGMWVESFEPNR
jgi:hypothetical protein